MKMSVLLMTLAVILAPAVAVAAGCAERQAAITCAAGYVFDEESRGCVPQTS